jgi:hypothetical protein
LSIAVIFFGLPQLFPDCESGLSTAVLRAMTMKLIDDIKFAGVHAHGAGEGEWSFGFWSKFNNCFASFRKYFL